MAITNQNFMMFQGETKNITASVTDDDGSALDLTGISVKWALRKQMNNKDNIILKSSEIKVSGNTLTITIESDDTAFLNGVYFHECKMIDAAGKSSVLFTGNITVNVSELGPTAVVDDGQQITFWEDLQAQINVTNANVSTNTSQITTNTTSLAAIAYQPENYKLPADTDYSNAFAQIVQAISTNGGGSIILGQGKIYTGNIALNQVSHVLITGKGILKGTITISGTSFPSDTQRYSGNHDIVIRDIIIDGEGTRNGIVMEYVFGVQIEENLIQNCTNAIFINDHNYTQHVSRSKINRNRFLNCGKNFVSQSAYSIYTIGDLQFIGNYSETTFGAALANTNGILVDHVDGIQISENVFFGSNGSTDTHIHIQSCSWLNIDNNQIFLGMNYGIYLYDIQNLKIVDNIICWQKGTSIELKDIQGFKISDNVISWRLAPTDTYTGYGIHVGRDANVDTNTWGVISDNMIILPPNQGIFTDSVGKINIADNTLIGTNSNTSYPIQANFTEYTTIVGNMIYGFTNKVFINGGTNVYEFNTFNGNKTTYSNFATKLRTKVYSGGETSISVDDVDVIIFNNSAATTINTITSSDLTTSRKITFFSYNANTILSRSTPNLTTYGSAGTLTIGATGSLEVLVYGGALLEINRNNVS